MQLLLTGLPLLLCIACTAAVYPMHPMQLLVLLLFEGSFVLLMALVGLLLGVKMPTLTWTNEIVPIKQGGAVMLTLFGGFGYIVLLFVGFMLLPGWILGFCRYMSCFVAANLFLSVLAYHFIRSAAEAKRNAPAAFLQVGAGAILPEKLQRQQCAFCKGGNCVDNRRPGNHFTAGSTPPSRRTAAASRKPRTYQIIFESPHFVQSRRCGLYRLNFPLVKALLNFFRREAVGKQLVHVLW